jgi:hypothetical protein
VLTPVFRNIHYLPILIQHHLALLSVSPSREPSSTSSGISPTPLLNNNNTPSEYRSSINCARIMSYAGGYDQYGGNPYNNGPSAEAGEGVRFLLNLCYYARVAIEE